MFNTQESIFVLFLITVSSYAWRAPNTWAGFATPVHHDILKNRKNKRRTRRLGVTSDSVPEVNPYADKDAVSLSGVPYESVLSGLERLYPSQELYMRNAKSRTDGYWKYISQGEEPPMELTYGEFDFHFFAQLLDRAHHHFYIHDDHPPPSWDDKTFCDLGSGTGRLVIAAAALHPGWKVCRGIELLEGIHNDAVENLNKCRRQGSRGDMDSLVLPCYADASAPSPTAELPMAPVELKCGSFSDPYEYLGDIDCAIVASSCLSDLMEELGKAIGRQLKPGSIVITIDYSLPLVNTIEPVEGDDSIPYGTYQLELVEKVDGYCWVTGGGSTAYFHRVVKSLSS